MKAIHLSPIIALFLLAGCLTTQPPENKKLDNSTQRLELIGALSAGVDASLDNNKVDDAKKLNQNIGQLAETPTPEAVNFVMASLRGDADRAKLDDEITKLILEKKKIEQLTQQELAKLRESNSKLKADAEASEAELKKLSNPFYAIKYGLVTLIKRFIYTLTGIGIVYMLLRIFAGSNPIVGAVFGVVEQLVALVIRGISWLFPRLFRYSGYTPTKDFDAVKESRNAIVDTLETIYTKHGETGTIKISQIFATLSDNLSESDKLEVKRALKEKGWR
jgi:hypothetical protein